MSCFGFIAAEKANHPVDALCRALGVSRAGFYAWRARPPSARARRDAELLEQIRSIHGDSEGSYGWPRIHAELRHQGVHVSRKRVARLMRGAGLSGLVARRKGTTTIRIPGVVAAPDLVARDFNPTVSAPECPTLEMGSITPLQSAEPICTGSCWGRSARWPRCRNASAALR